MRARDLCPSPFGFSGVGPADLAVPDHRQVGALVARTTQRSVRECKEGVLAKYFSLPLAKGESVHPDVGGNEPPQAEPSLTRSLKKTISYA